MSALANQTAGTATLEARAGNPPAYRPLTQAHLQELGQLLGHDHVLSGPAIPGQFSHDAGTKNEIPHSPEAVVFPADADQVGEVLKFANRHLTPVTPRGGGSGLAGGAVGLFGGIILDLKRLNRIIKLDANSRYAVVEPGVRTLDLQLAAREKGLLYAGDPCSSDDCVIGGNIATNAGGNRAVKYGVTSDQVMELEVVTAAGDKTVLGGRLKKNSTGYQLTRLFAGSEGTLGIITRATLKLRKLAPLIPDWLVVLPQLKEGMALIQELADDSLIDPITLEIIDRRTVAAMERLADFPIFGKPQGDILIVQFEAYNFGELKDKENRLAKICKVHKIKQVHRAKDPEAVWTARRTWGKAIAADIPVSTGEDVVVPVDKLVDLISGMEALLVRYGLDFRLAGHAGDGNMHISTLPGRVSLDNWPKASADYRTDLYQLVYRLGGKLSGEHGIGLKRKESFTQVVDPVELTLMKSIKLALDPNLILNPGKIFEI